MGRSVDFLDLGIYGHGQVDRMEDRSKNSNQPPFHRPTQRAADGGYAPRFLAVFWLWAFPVSTVSPRSHLPQLTQTVGQQNEK